MQGKDSLKQSISTHKGVGNRLVEEFNEKHILTNTYWGNQNRVTNNTQPIPPRIPLYRMLRKIVRAPEGDTVNEKPRGTQLPTISSANSGHFFDRKKAAKV